mgnify:CR=1 FL=1
MKCIHKNQYDYIKSGTIQDCIGWSLEYLHQCHQSKRPIVILKLDFEKSFDSIEQEAILLILKYKGFIRNGFLGLSSCSPLEHHQSF